LAAICTSRTMHFSFNHPSTPHIDTLSLHDARPISPLKSLQGKIWDEGYRRGDLRSQVFEDVPRAFKRWRERGKTICIYSSGSVRSEEHTSELQSLRHLVCRLLLEKKKHGRSRAGGD